MYLAPNGFWLAPSNHTGKLYGPTQPGADWHIAQWDIPDDLPAFDSAGVSQNRWARVAWLGNGRYELSQDATGLPCDRLYPSRKRLVNEFDLFALPNNANEPRSPQAVADNREHLSDLSSIRAGITLQVTRLEVIDKNCPVTQSSFMFAVVLSNLVKRQFLFYQLRLGLFRIASAASTERGFAPNWYFTGKNTQAGKSGQWGFGDNITTFAQPWAQVGEAHSYQIDLMPRLRWLIRQGERHGLDQELKHWQLTGTYHGQGAFGHIRNDAIWSQFSLAIK